MSARKDFCTVTLTPSIILPVSDDVPWREDRLTWHHSTHSSRRPLPSSGRLEGIYGTLASWNIDAGALGSPVALDPDTCTDGPHDQDSDGDNISNSSTSSTTSTVTVTTSVTYPPAARPAQ
ncbi:hypothetical protein RRG08_059339 [Elysia crispata]|uniref:Uncharacterized protein n=1 Tax=Elysia crispata TaxID=231223 RepID=A0AAE1BDN3_9GAST|nr:hypothetical protein RRG08_059339 [Elysia crispata]